jgi:hypothetical protein
MWILRKEKVMSCNHILHDKEQDEYFCGKFKSIECQELRCKAICNIKLENGFIIDYRSIYVAKDKNGTSKYGWRVFNKDYSFIGLLDENKLAVWYVNENTLANNK